MYFDELPMDKASGRYAIMSSVAHDLSSRLDGENDKELKDVLYNIAAISQRLSRNYMKMSDSFSHDRDIYKQRIAEGYIPKYLVMGAPEGFYYCNKEDRKHFLEYDKFDDADSAYRSSIKYYESTRKHGLLLRFEVVERWYPKEEVE